MKHQPAIHIQRLVNMKSGIVETQRYLDTLICKVEDEIKNGITIEKTKKIVDNLVEIQSLLDWVRNQ